MKWKTRNNNRSEQIAFFLLLIEQQPLADKGSIFSASDWLGMSCLNKPYEY